jgi:hypothetical protein
MSLLRFIQNQLPARRRQLHQDTFGDEAAMTLLANEDVAALKRHFAGIPANWTDRYFYSLALSRSFPMEALQRWAESEPGSADAHLVYGARLLKWSWDARGYGRGHDVSQEQAKEFFRRLALTRAALETSADLHGEDPTPWTYLVMVALYDNSGLEASGECFQQAAARDPENWPAHMHRLMSLTEKWGGSHSQMFEFARESASIARPHSLLPLLITKAHLEYWKYLAMFQNDEAQATEYLKSKDAREETLAAYQKTLGSQQYEPREALFARINAIGWFWLSRNREPLRNELRVLGGRLDDIHLRWVGSEGELARARQFAGL